MQIATMQVAGGAEVQECQMQNVRKREFEFQDPEGSFRCFPKSPMKIWMAGFS